MKTFKGILYGIAIAIAVSAGAATVSNYFPPPGMTYTPTTGLVIGTATGGAQGTGTVNAQGVFINGTAALTSAGVPTGANPTGAVGLAAVNGVATTFLRSDSAPPLSQSIVPTWTGLHTFSGNVVFNNSSAATDTKNTLFRESTVSFSIQSATDAAPSTPVTALLSASRTGTAWTAVSIGNATDNPTYSFLGTGQFSIGGGEVVGSPTGGNQGTGTINMQGCFVNGVACSTGGAAGANPTGTVGLTAVNGVAGTFTRSDGTPPLSQAIAPTWTGTHTFSSLVGNGATVFQGANTGSGYNIKFRDTTNSVDRGFIGLGTTTVAGAAVTDFVISPGTSGSVVIGTAAGGAIGTRFGPNGNVTVNAPSSGVPLTVTNSSAGSIATFNGGNVSGGFITFQSNGSDTSYWGSANRVFSGGVNDAALTSLGSNHLMLGTNSLSRIDISGSGNITVNAPSSGTTSTVTTLSGGVAESYIGPNTGAGFNVNFFDSTNSAFRGFIGLGTSTVGGAAVTDFAISPGISGSVVIGTSNGTAIGTRFGPNGNVTISAPTSGNGLTATGVANNYAAQFLASSTSGQSYGINIKAGTTSADFALFVNNQAASLNLFGIAGDGSVVVGAPTGGAKGLGTINMTGCFVNGSPCLTGSTTATRFAAGVLTVTGSGSCLAQNTANISTCTSGGTGLAHVTFTTSFSSATCVAGSVDSSPVLIATNPGTSVTSTADFDLRNTSSTLANGSFSITCIGN